MLDWQMEVPVVEMDETGGAVSRGWLTGAPGTGLPFI